MKTHEYSQIKNSKQIQFITSSESDERVNSTWLMITLIEYYSIHITHIADIHFCRYSTHDYSNLIYWMHFINLTSQLNSTTLVQK